MPPRPPTTPQHKNTQTHTGTHITTTPPHPPTLLRTPPTPPHLQQLPNDAVGLRQVALQQQYAPPGAALLVSKRSARYTCANDDQVPHLQGTAGQQGREREGGRDAGARAKGAWQPSTSGKTEHHSCTACNLQPYRAQNGTGHEVP